MAMLELEEVKANVLRYGSVLLNHVPDETTELLISLCTDYKPSNSPIVKEVGVGSSKVCSLNIFVSKRLFKDKSLLNLFGLQMNVNICCCTCSVQNISH